MQRPESHRQPSSRKASPSHERHRSGSLEPGGSTSVGIVAEKSNVCRSTGKRIKNLIDLWCKAHIEHTVGFIEHQHFNRTPN